MSLWWYGRADWSNLVTAQIPGRTRGSGHFDTLVVLTYTSSLAATKEVSEIRVRIC
jgi:hypothetical protein